MTERRMVTFSYRGSARRVEPYGLGHRLGHWYLVARRGSDGIRAYRADWVINCAAYTHVDKAEQEQDLVFRVNRDSAKAVAQGVSSYGGRLLHVSTDFIFGGEQSHPYAEHDTANPLGVYGQSK